jgi:hypothetical protein
MDVPPVQHNLWSIPGDGVLARQGSLVLLTGADDPGFTEALLELLARISADGGNGLDLADAISDELRRHKAWGGDSVSPAIVAFGPDGDGLAFAVSGDVEVEFSTEHTAEQPLVAGHPSMLVRAAVAVPVLAVRAALSGYGDGGSGRTDRFSRLDGGTIRAGGLSYHPGQAGAAQHAASPAPVSAQPAAAPAFAAAPAEPAPEAVEPTIVDRPHRPAPAPDPEDTGPVPALHTLVGMPVPAPTVIDYPDAEAQQNPSAPLVLGIHCRNGHFTDPDTRACVICGTESRRLGAEPEPGPRPALGVLILDDGTTLPVDCDYVIGRNPSKDESVASGAARPLRVSDDLGSVSRVHARIELNAWQVLLTDLGSGNGTHVQPRGAAAPQRLEPQVPMAIQPGTRFFVGAPCLRYEVAVPSAGG